MPRGRPHIKPAHRKTTILTVRIDAAQRAKLERLAGGGDLSDAVRRLIEQAPEPDAAPAEEVSAVAPPMPAIRWSAV